MYNPELCKQTRQDIYEAAVWLDRIDSVPDNDDPDYDGFEDNANDAITKAVEAFKNKPTGCQMEMFGDDDTFECETCNFSHSTDVLDA